AQQPPRRAGTAEHQGEMSQQPRQPGAAVVERREGQDEHAEYAYQPCQHTPRCRYGYALCPSAYFWAPVWVWQRQSAYHVGAPGRFSVKSGRTTVGIRSRVIILRRPPMPGG